MQGERGGRDLVFREEMHHLPHEVFIVSIVLTEVLQQHVPIRLPTPAIPGSPWIKKGEEGPSRLAAIAEVAEDAQHLGDAMAHEGETRREFQLLLEGIHTRHVPLRSRFTSGRVQAQFLFVR